MRLVKIHKTCPCYASPRPQKTNEFRVSLQTLRGTILGHLDKLQRSEYVWTAQEQGLSAQLSDTQRCLDLRSHFTSERQGDQEDQETDPLGPR